MVITDLDITTQMSISPQQQAIAHTYTATAVNVISKVSIKGM